MNSSIKLTVWGDVAGFFQFHNVHCVVVIFSPLLPPPTPDDSSIFPDNPLPALLCVREREVGGETERDSLSPVRVVCRACVRGSSLERGPPASGYSTKENDSLSPGDHQLPKAPSGKVESWEPVPQRRFLKGHYKL